MASSKASTETTLPLTEETMHVEKREVSKGKVRVKTTVDTVEEIARATLSEDDIEVTRVPVGTYVEAAPSVHTAGDLTIIPVLEEVLVVEKRLLLVEEIHVRRSTKTEEVAVPITLRKQRAVVETVGPEASKTPT